MKEVTEVNYVCEICEQRYVIKEDCELCEKSCKMLKAIATAVPELEDAVDSLSGAAKYKAANIMNEYQKLSTNE